jgi:hypothetical protein
MKLFVDTGAFIALTNADDEHHGAAAFFYREARRSGTRFFATNLVVCETMNYLKIRISRVVAVRFWESLKKSGHISIFPVSPSLEDSAFAIFKHYADKGFSFTDCTSFAAMKSFKIRKAFAFDKHFAQMEGIDRLP